MFTKVGPNTILHALPLAMMLAITAAFLGCKPPEPTVYPPEPLPEMLAALPRPARIECEYDPNLDRARINVWSLPGMGTPDSDSGVSGFRGEVIGTIGNCEPLRLTGSYWDPYEGTYWVEIERNELVGWLDSRFISTEAVAAAPTPRPTAAVTMQMGTPETRQYHPVAMLSRDRYLMDVAWEGGGQSLIYAVQGTRSIDNIAYLEPKNWDWWQFDMATQQSLSLPPPKSAIGNEARHVLGLCVQDEDGAGCNDTPRLWESPYGDWVIYVPVGQGEEAWIAGKDGANATLLAAVYLPQDVSWSADGRWAIVSGYAYRAPGMEVHYLVDLAARSAQALGQLTGHTLEFVNYQRPVFSPDSRYVVYAATDNVDHTLEENYGLFLLDLSRLQAGLLSRRFGPFQWQASGDGLYVLDDAVNFEFAEDMSARRTAALYAIDISRRPAIETLLDANIDFYPQDTLSAWHWAYSPEAQAIAMVGFSPRHELGILVLGPP